MEKIIANKPEYRIYRKFIAQNIVMSNKKKETNDILNKPPIRYLAYSNEIGSAISPINKSLGTALWAPALLYLGADIYDKYKNEDTTYNPSARRSVRQAIFQGFASVILPSSAIALGQKIGVRIASAKDSLSAMDKKELVEFTLNQLNSATFPRKENEEFSTELVEAFYQHAQANKIKVQAKSFLDKLLGAFHESSDCDGIITKYIKDKDKQAPIINYLSSQGKIVDDIMRSEKNIQADRYIKFFNKSNAKYGNIQVAKLDTIKKLLKDKTINKSIVATISGFVALFLLMKPIDIFVENVLMEKIVNPIFEKIPTKQDKQNQNQKQNQKLNSAS